MIPLPTNDASLFAGRVRGILGRIVLGTDDCLGIEGVPFTGKTTHLRALLRSAGRPAVVVPEHMDVDWRVRRLASRPWPEGLPRMMFRRQQQVLVAERIRAGLARQALADGSHVLLDRTVLSPLLYGWHRAGPGMREALTARLEELLRTPPFRTVFLPRRLLLLVDDPVACARRAVRALAGGDARMTEAFFLGPDTLARLQDAYVAAVDMLGEFGVRAEIRQAGPFAEAGPQ